tara:strand:+ start:1096 stop:1656 length:561 start_codon:yes stop_codon:yes gene_type:complete
MNYSIILLGSDLKYLQDLSTRLIESTKLENVISIFDIRKQFNNNKPAGEFFSQAMFYEKIENSTDTNNIIIPDDIINVKLNYLNDYVYFLPGMKFYLCIVKDKYKDYKDNFQTDKHHKRKYRISKELSSQTVTDRVTYESKLDNIIYDDNRFKKLIIDKEEDIYNQYIKFTEFCVENNIKLIEEES